MNLKTITAEIDKKIANLNQLKLAVADLFEASQVNGATRPRKTPGTRRKMSASARARISAAQKARWAKWKADGRKSQAPPKTKRSRSKALWARA